MDEIKLKEVFEGELTEKKRLFAHLLFSTDKLDEEELKLCLSDLKRMREAIEKEGNIYAR